MKYWFYHDASDSYFLEDENYTSQTEEVFMLKYDESVSENIIAKLHVRDNMIKKFDATNGEITKPKINNWNDILTKVKSTYNSLDLKVKHATEEYANLPHAPEADDILHFIFSKKKSLIELSELIELFGAHRRDLIEDSITWLLNNNMLLGYSFQDGIYSEEWSYSSTDKFSINVNYNE